MTTGRTDDPKSVQATPAPAVGANDRRRTTVSTLETRSGSRIALAHTSVCAVRRSRDLALPLHISRAAPWPVLLGGIAGCCSMGCAADCIDGAE